MHDNLFKHVFRELNADADAAASLAYDVSSFEEFLVPRELWPLNLLAAFDGSRSSVSRSSVGICVYEVTLSRERKLLYRAGRVLSGPCNSSTWAEAMALRMLAVQLRKWFVGV